MHRFCQLFLLFFPSLLSFSVLAEHEIVFADSPYPPYVLGNTTDKVPQGGTAVDLVKQFFDELPQYDVQFNLLPWKRVLRELEKGSVDAVTMVAKTPEREDFLDFSSELVSYKLAFFYDVSVFPEEFVWEDLADLSPYRIGVVEGYLSDSKLFELVAQGAPLRPVRVPGNEQQLFRMLLNGRLDLVCFKLESGKTLLRQQQWSDVISAHPKALYNGAYYLGFSKAQQHGELIDRLNPIIKTWRQSGKLNAILHPHSPE